MFDEATLRPFLEAAHAAADAAGATVRRFHQAGFEVEQKSDASLVTTADVATERTLRAVLQSLTPDVDIHGEELEATGQSSTWRWLLDPIDGTIAFACGKPLFTTLIALLHDGVPALGIIDQPVTGDRWVGTPYGTTLGARPARVRAPVPLAHARVGCTAPGCLPSGLVPALEAACQTVSWGGDAYNYGVLASGSVDAVLEVGLAPHDYAALVPVVRGAGGVVTDWRGEPIEQVDGRRDVLACSSPEVHTELLALVRDRA